MAAAVAPRCYGSNHIIHSSGDYSGLGRFAHAVLACCHEEILMPETSLLWVDIQNAGQSEVAMQDRSPCQHTICVIACRTYAAVSVDSTGWKESIIHSLNL